MESHYSLHVEALRPILYAEDVDFQSVDADIALLAKKANADIKEFSMGYGSIDFQTKKQRLDRVQSLSDFLEQHKDSGYNRHTFLLLKDIHPLLSTGGEVAPEHHQIIAQLRHIAERTMYTPGYHCTIFIISGVRVIPNELEHLITLVPTERPDQSAIEAMLANYAKELGFQLDDIGNLALEFKGLSRLQIRLILDLAYCDGGYVSLKKDKDRILDEKKQIIDKSGLLEFVKPEKGEAIGGLNALKAWLYRKAYIFANLDKALKMGIDVPRGVLMLGIPGCGKSLSAKATASILGKPLLRLDVGRILGKYVGESEKNMRRALSLAEAVSPCVLWIDEIEKAFAGGSDRGHEVTVRLIGQFLTWMQEKKSTVFVVATANNIQNLPPEFLRKGRFDEIFSVDLPDWNERLEILKIKLKERNQPYRDLSLHACKNITENFSGADISAAVSHALESAFIDERDFITDDDLQNAIKSTIPLYKSMEKEITEIQNKLKKYDIRSVRGNETIHRVLNKPRDNEKTEMPSRPFPNAIKGITFPDVTSWW